MARSTIPSGWRLKKVTATGQWLNAGEIFGGLMHPTTGTTTTVALYDDTSAAAGSLIIATTATLTAGQFVDPTGGVVTITAARGIGPDGLRMNLGLWGVVGGTGSPVFWVLYK
jgi:hypothetical protein